MTDQHRWDCVGVNGNTLIKTPNLDRLAAGAANFTHAFVQAPVCGSVPRQLLPPDAILTRTETA